nr:murein biosynthesis integral membrane protein MurJ [Helicobacter saguini]
MQNFKQNLESNLKNSNENTESILQENKKQVFKIGDNTLESHEKISDNAMENPKKISDDKLKNHKTKADNTPEIPKKSSEKNPKSKSLKKFFLTNACGIMCSRIFGFIRDALQASTLGVSIYSDIFFIAFKFPNMFRRIVSEGAFVQSFLPFFLSARNKGAFSVSIFFIFLFFLLILSALVMWCAPFITQILALGYDADRIALATPLVRIHFWYLILIFIVTYLSTLLQYKSIFWVNAYNTVLLNVAMISAMIVAKSNNMDMLECVYVISYSVLVGGILQIMLHFYPMYGAKIWLLQYVGFKSLWKWIKILRNSTNITESKSLDSNNLQNSQLDSNKVIESSKNSNNDVNLDSINKQDSKEIIESKSLDSNKLQNLQLDSKNIIESKIKDSQGLQTAFISTSHHCPPTENKSHFEALATQNSTQNAQKRIQFIHAKHKFLTLIHDIKVFFKAFFPAMLGASSAQIIAVIDSSLVTLLPQSEGGVSVLNFANRIFQLPLAIFAIAISTALFPSVAKAIKNKDESTALTSLKTAFWFLFVTLSLCTLGGIMLRNEIIWLLFERGHFTRADTFLVADAFFGYMVGLLAFGLARIFSLWLYSYKKQAKAAKISVLSLFVGVLLSAFFILYMRYFYPTDSIESNGILWQYRYLIIALSGSIGGFFLLFLSIKEFGLNNFFTIISHKKYLFLLIILLTIEYIILHIFKFYFIIS